MAPGFRMVCSPAVLAGAPDGWGVATLQDGEVALLADDGGLPTAPNSHPDPMIEPSDAQRSPRKPTPLSIASVSSVSRCGASTSAINPPGV
jgi:hypothetical protein